MFFTTSPAPFLLSALCFTTQPSQNISLQWFLDLVKLKLSFVPLVIKWRGKKCTKQNLFHYEADRLQMKKCDSLFENIDFSLLSDGMAHWPSSCLSVRVSAEKCSMRTVAEDLLATQGDWQMGHWDWLWNLDGVAPRATLCEPPHLRKCLVWMQFGWNYRFPLAKHEVSKNVPPMNFLTLTWANDS